MYNLSNKLNDKSTLLDQCKMWEWGEDVFSQNHKHANKLLSMEDVERILDLPIHAFPDADRQISSSYEWDVLPGALAGQHDNGSTIMLDYNMMGVSNMIHQHELQSRGRRTESLSSYNSTETNSWDGMKFSSPESVSWDSNKHRTELNSSEYDSFDNVNKIRHNSKDKIGKVGGEIMMDNFLTESSTQIQVLKDEPKEESILDKPQIPSKTDDKGATVVVQCSICSKPALKHCSYGGTSCSSCRSFFRRSVQSKYHLVYSCKQDSKSCRMETESRKKCQHCRFQSCLSSGMKITWVLSDQERGRRFKKLKSSKKFAQQLLPRPSVLYLAFSVEENRILDKLQSNFQVPWLKNFMIFDRDAGINLIEYVFGFAGPKLETWTAFKQSMKLNFIRYILPRFSELADLSSHDIGQLMNSPTSDIAQFFRSCHMFHMGDEMSGKAESCTIATSVVTMSSNQDIVNSLDLHGLLSRLDLSRGVSGARMASYEDLYPEGWAEDRLAEGRHREAVHKIVNWPKDEKNMFDYWMVALLTIILTFHADFYTLDNRDMVENIQLKYIIILQRYLRFKFEPGAANTKFIEAMLLISETRQAWEASVVNKMTITHTCNNL